MAADTHEKKSGVDKDTPSEYLKTREEWLREEVKNHRVLLFSLLQWGMALLLGVESALYFVRRDVAQAATGKPFVFPAKVLSFTSWFYGTTLLIVVALLFSLLTLNLLKRYLAYRKQLLKAAMHYSKIDDSPVKNYGWVPLAFLWAVPILDLVFWHIFHK